VGTDIVGTGGDEVGVGNGVGDEVGFSAGTELV
jgi:hypothetical protein